MTMHLFIKTGAFALLLTALFFACTPTDPAMPAPELSLSRTFSYTNLARQLRATYATGQLTGMANQSQATMSMSMGSVGASQQAAESVLLNLPTGKLKPGLTGTYPADSLNRTFTGQYVFTPDAATQTGQPGSLPTSFAVIDKFEPGSVLTISEYNQNRGVISGRFTLLFFVADPFWVSPRLPMVNVTPEQVLVTLTSTFSNLPLTRSQ
jgi:hypothetical protein